MDSEDPYLTIPWDAASEQPHFIRHKRTLLQRIRYGFADYLKTGLVGLAFVPGVAFHHFRLACGLKPAGWHMRNDDPREFVGLAVALSSCPPDRLAKEIVALGVKHVLLRIPVWEVDELDKYRRFLEDLPEADVVVCIMQDRAHVLDPDRWRRNLRRIVSACWPRVQTYQIGQGVNRSKWGFFTATEYLAFAAEAEKIRSDHPGIKLVGPSILDFETLPLLRGLIHGYDFRWDAVACALYVDRRGSPRNRQLLLFDLKHKIYHFAACILCSRKAERRFWITEVNWPIKDQGAYSPVQKGPCYSEEEAGRFLREYYEDAWSTGIVERVYWWQLVAKGFGLMDVAADGSLRPRPAYFEFQKLLEDGLKRR